ncbi:type 1 fimbrial protein [Salmonella enterica subsp. houtenae serovar 44:z36,[z38]:-]|nr:type 1 fimbrial protein [Salmonella enterica]EHM8759230.1 type 1 fimbrial protein [Salmonella enterica subsp. houtenae serovar 44:z36,[z38]:-]HCM6269248.1 type 1 fimbrial protein [Salmonella enterica subsp. houtenae serovar 44:z36,Z38:-]EHL5472061.1 type 1 fimbrial protein [Salmonella enterica]EHL5481239.1 type 1 fimbrial protein [Salmonella enterica]
MSVKSKITVATVMALGLMSMNTMAAVNSGRVTFSGTVVDTPCNLAPGADGEDVPVDFGQLSLSQLNANQASSKEFDINLTGCDLTSATPAKTASITFSSLNTNTAKTMIEASGRATGLGIGIDGITFGTEKNLDGLHDGDNTLTFTAKAQKLSADTNVTAGNFTAVSTFVINYK